MFSPTALFVRAHLNFFAHHRIKHSDFCCFKGVTHVALTLCFKLIKFFFIDLHRPNTLRQKHLLFFFNNTSRRKVRAKSFRAVACIA